MEIRLFLEWKYKKEMHRVRDMEYTRSSPDRTCLTGNLRSIRTSVYSDFFPSEGTASATNKAYYQSKAPNMGKLKFQTKID